ncbi:MAG TPA: hypothetical protein VIS75_02230, partial [Chitinophagaceae bacterium]
IRRWIQLTLPAKPTNLLLNLPTLSQHLKKTTEDVTENLAAQTNDEPNIKSDKLNPAQTKAIQKANTPQDQPKEPLLAEIKSSDPSNFSQRPSVPQIGTVAKVEPKTIELANPIVDQQVTLAKLNEDDPQQEQATYASNVDDGQIEVLNTTVSNKNKMRGFFRKVGRVVDKATNIGPADESEDKKGIRIASFQIALK